MLFLPEIVPRVVEDLAKERAEELSIEQQEAELEEKVRRVLLCSCAPRCACGAAAS